MSFLCDAESGRASTGRVFCFGYDDGGTSDDESDDGYFYYIRWYRLTSGRNSSYGEIWLYDPDFLRVQIWSVEMLMCVAHGANDGLVANPNGEIHGVIIPVSVSVMEKVGTYRFVLHFYDDYSDSYKNHQVKAALEVNRHTAPLYYISDVEDGWLLVKLEPSGETVALPYTLKVKLNKTQRGRDYFTILEGVHKNKNASVKRRSDGTSYLTARLKHKPLIKLVYSKSSQTLRIEGSGETYRAIMDPPLPNGTYVIELPDYPHSLGEPYRDRAKRARTWFRIRVEGARYLHTGQVTAGCLTVTDIDKWDRLYDKIIMCRRDDETHGYLQIVD